MCGICGFINPSLNVDAERILTTMCRRLVHRGPDDEGYYQHRQANLAMRRLSIIDLASGRQPISNEDNTLHLVFNGEIYNYRELRRQLVKLGYHFVTHSDSEVIIHAFEEYGASCLQQFNGMFAFAIWNERDQTLFLARDRIGIKPLYYWIHDETLLFGSELKALLAYPDCPRQIDFTALDHYLTLEYIPSPRTILAGVKKLPPGHFMRFDAGKATVEAYWDITCQPDQSPGNAPTLADRVAELQALIQDSVRLRMISDVPVGAFLSGGIDSSTIVSYMGNETHEPVHTFSIGFEDATYNELPYAREMANFAETNHRERILQPNIADLIEHLIDFIDEPLADFSIFPTYLVSSLAAESVKVVLSGDGGDEVFGGYDTYVAQSYYDRLYQQLPVAIQRNVLPAILRFIPPASAKKGWINKAKRFVEGAALPDTLQHARWMLFMTPSERADLYRRDRIGDTDGSPEQTLMDYFQAAPFTNRLAQQQYVDIKSYLAENILTKVDRMSMAASIEARVPLLDHRIVEFGLNLPSALRMENGQTKILLRKAVAGRIVPSILNKPKEGFSIPMKQWLGTSLQPMMRDLLAPGRLQQSGHFDSLIVQQWIDEHLQGRANHSHRLWALMLFELWRDRWIQ